MGIQRIFLLLLFYPVFFPSLKFFSSILQFLNFFHSQDNRKNENFSPIEIAAHHATMVGASKTIEKKNFTKILELNNN